MTTLRGREEPGRVLSSARSAAVAAASGRFGAASGAWLSAGITPGTVMAGAARGVARGPCRGAELGERSLVGGPVRAAARPRPAGSVSPVPWRVGGVAKPASSSDAASCVTAVGHAEHDRDQRAAVARRGRDERVLRAAGEAGLEADRAGVVGAAARQQLVVVDEMVRARRVGSTNEYSCERRPLRDLGHGERVARRDREVVRAHERTALVRRLVVEAGRVAERAVAQAELLARSRRGRSRTRRGCRRRCRRSRTRRRWPTPSSSTPSSGRTATACRPAGRCASSRPLASRAFAVTSRAGAQALDRGERGHDLGGARGVHRVVHAVADQDPAGARVDDDVGLRRRERAGRRRRPSTRRDGRDADSGGERPSAAPTDAAKRRGGGAWAVQARREPVRREVGLGAAAPKRLGSGRGRRATMESWPLRRARISARIAAIQESATLAVDAKAKALKAAGENVIGFGAGEPDFPTPAHVVEAAIAACRDPRFHHYSPTPGLPELREAIAFKTKRDSGRRLRRGRRSSSRTAASTPSTTPSRCCATRATRCCCPRRTGRRIPRCIALGGRRAGRAADDRRPTASASRSSSSKPRVHAAHEGVALRLAEQPDRRGVSARGGRGDRALGARARHLGRHRRDLRAPHLRRSRVLVDAGPRPRARWTRA